MVALIQGSFSAASEDPKGALNRFINIHPEFIEIANPLHDALDRYLQKCSPVNTTNCSIRFEKKDGILTLRQAELSEKLQFLSEQNETHQTNCADGLFFRSFSFDELKLGTGTPHQYRESKFYPTQKHIIHHLERKKIQALEKGLQVIETHVALDALALSNMQEKEFIDLSRKLFGSEVKIFFHPTDFKDPNGAFVVLGAIVAPDENPYYTTRTQEHHFAVSCNSITKTEEPKLFKPKPVLIEKNDEKPSWIIHTWQILKKNFYDEDRCFRRRTRRAEKHIYDCPRI